MKVSVLVPAYNEVRTVEEAIARLRELPLPIEVIAVDDGSTDGTREVLERLRREGLVDVLILHERNRGKGRAVRSAIERVTGEIAVIYDADLELDAADIPPLVEPIMGGRADAVFGSRFLGGPHALVSLTHRAGNAGLTWLSNLLGNICLTDMETCYKAVRTDLLRSLPLRTERFGIEPELTARLVQSRARLYEVPISYHGRTREEGKKIGWRDGIAAVWHILRANLLPPRAKRYVRPVAEPMRIAVGPENG